MEQEVLFRLKFLLDNEFSGNMSEFARKIDLGKQTVSDYFCERRKMSFAFVAKTILGLNLSAEWVIRGTGPMKKGENNSVHMEQVQIGDGNAIGAHAQANIPVPDSKLAEENLKLKIENEILRHDKEELLNRLIAK